MRCQSLQCKNGDGDRDAKEAGSRRKEDKIDSKIDVKEGFMKARRQLAMSVGKEAAE